MNISEKRPQTILFPGKYIQGYDCLRYIGEHTTIFSDNALLCGGGRALDAVRDVLIYSFKKSGVRWIEELFSGNPTQKEVDRLANIGRMNNVGVIIGVGGGRALDTMKAVADQIKLPIVMVPTIASTDAPTSTVSTIYHDNGEYSHYNIYKKNPDVVIVDTKVLSKAPVRYFISGIGGAIGVSYEAEACYLSGGLTTAGGSSSSFAVACARMAREFLLKNGDYAKLSCEKQVWSPAFEKCVEANLLLSGIGFESGGLSLAHSIFRGYRHSGKKDCLHGEVVAFGTLVQLILENRDQEEISSLYSFFRKIGIPTTLKQIGVDVNDQTDLEVIAEYACGTETAMNMLHKFKPSAISAAMVLADSLGVRNQEYGG